MSWSEVSLHAWLAERWAERASDAPDPRVGSFGHDAAVLAPQPGRPVLCVDQTLEGVHYDPAEAGDRVGRKAAARALSDLAATAARPTALLLALQAPARVAEPWLRAAIVGVDEMAQRFGARLVGGDLSQGPGPTALSVSALGHMAGRRRSPGRDLARAGDVVLLSGPVGGSALGRHLDIEPRLDEGLWLHAQGARVLMDVSDGLALDLSRIAAASGMRIELHDVPLHMDAQRAAQLDGRSALEHALADGEDHELVATLPAKTWQRIEDEAGQRFPALCPIGRVTRGEGLWTQLDGGEPRPYEGRGGWRHGE